MVDARVEMICPWALQSDIEHAYHDREWGRPLHDERRLFEMLVLEGVQAGLSWRTVLAKRDHYRLVFDGFNAEKIARYGDAKIAALLADPGIIRNRLKVNAAITNARAYLALRDSGTSLDTWLWNWMDGVPQVNHYHAHAQLPAYTEKSDRISNALTKLGFKFVGSTIVYAYMQSTGMVDDHLVTCPCHSERRGHA